MLLFLSAIRLEVPLSISSRLPLDALMVVVLPPRMSTKLFLLSELMLTVLSAPSMVTVLLFSSLVDSRVTVSLAALRAARVAAVPGAAPLVAAAAHGGRPGPTQPNAHAATRKPSTPRKPAPGK
ncbi:hypothetical protein [Mycolicibacterium sp.]|uniref:hypothetical protein n=1 Tax=Mycolicibacterium sp. TaxID=2320850 RepID=UPI0028A70697|nr:hypothetical protein [Mycolicibacterium sp.]